MNDVMAQIKDDERYLKYRAIVKRVQANFNKPARQAEIRSMFLERVAPSLKGKLPTVEKLYEAVVKDMAIRSRLVQIRGDIFELRDLLDLAITETRSYIRVQYLNDKEFGTAEDRRELAAQFVRTGAQVLSDLDTVSALIELYVKDIDQASFAMNKSVDMLKMLHERTPKISG